MPQNEEQQQGYLHQNETYKVIGICMEIHRILGRGLSEIVYKDALVYELQKNGIVYEREKEYVVRYKDTILPHKFVADFVVFEKIILEIKAKKNIIEEHYAQVLNYLGLSKLELALLINFHEKSLEHRRIIRTA